MVVQGEKESWSADRALMMLFGCNEALIQAHSEKELLNEICRIIVETGGYKIAWIGFIESDKTKSIHLVAQNGFENGDIEAQKIKWVDSQTIHAGEPQIMRNILKDPTLMLWHKQARKWGYRSSISFPLFTNGTVFGSLNIYSAQEGGAFKKDEFNLLLRMANDIAFGITAIRILIERNLAAEDLTNYREHLEELVTARTTALEEANRQLKKEIEARKSSEEGFCKSEEKFRALFNSANDTITIADLEGHFLEVNSMAIERLGYSREEFLRMTVNEVMAPEYRKSFPQWSIELTKRGCAIFETFHRRRDGMILPVELSMRIIDYAGQKAVLSIARDISERKRFDNIQNQFIIIASHELRTPISVLSQSINNLQKYYVNLTEEQKIKLIDTIFRNTNLLTELVDDLLMLSQLEERKLQLEWISYSPYTVFQEVLTQLEQKRMAKEIEIEYEIDQNTQLFGDPQKIGRIFRIFLDNSLKYSANKTKIRVKAIDNYKGPYNSSNVDGFLIEFTDSGRGINPEELPYLFVRFFRSKGVGDIPGTGLGLSIALNLIQLHQGKIHVETTYGKGTSIFLFLPRIENNSS
ncbi:MAG TPA: GAF domain-containing sensor histidine kinase [Candidatus Deferrimicrobium sp.]|nr:GAF domain-containing sensor histidine kinase [Candidatus Deferrimicrobium sp.]